MKEVAADKYLSQGERDIRWMRASFENDDETIAAVSFSVPIADSRKRIWGFVINNKSDPSYVIAKIPLTHWDTDAQFAPRYDGYFRIYAQMNQKALGLGVQDMVGTRPLDGVGLAYGKVGNYTISYKDVGNKEIILSNEVRKRMEILGVVEHRPIMRSQMYADRLTRDFGWLVYPVALIV